MARTAILFLLCHSVFRPNAQELFLLTNPASNVPKNTMVVRGMNSFFQRTIDNSVSYHAMPELEYGLSRKVMIIANSFISNEDNKFNLEGASFLTQYRFYSNDEAKRHFRMALWGRFSINNADIHQEEIELNGHNSGVRFGLTGTQLLHKTAISTTVSLQQAFDNLYNKTPASYSKNSIDYTLSVGQLVFPRSYKSFNQTNLNLMIEILGQTHLSNGKTYLDVAPVIQFIFNSRARLDIAYRRQVYSAMLRTQPNGIIVNFQYSIFNLVK
jgi:hypothetical protein